MPVAGALQNILGIETSCDETAVAVYSRQRGLLAHQIYSQVALHAEYGGVVPELASRDHVRKLGLLIAQALAEAGLSRADGIAYTRGPGLLGALLVGGAVARGLGMAWRVPVLGVHHMEGHLLSPLLEPDAPSFPFVALLVSGGHTLLVAVKGVGRYRQLGTTVDDAVGEAFDKTAKLLGLGYPGGPALARLAEEGDPGRFVFPRPMLDRPGLDFSFSGLKTAVALAVRDADPADHADIARGFEEAVTETLMVKCRRALQATGYARLVVAGGVGANRRLREQLDAAAAANGFRVYFPRQAFCTDNGAMIAHVGALRLPGDTGAASASASDPMAVARWPLASLQPPGA